MQSFTIKSKFINFYKSKGHKEVPNVPLIPENDPTSLFIMSGVQPLVPYIMGQNHPQGRRLVNIQRCLRTNDIDEVGDFHHNTFFEMLGVWSLGDYFKKESIFWTMEFLIEHLNFDPKRLYVTTFAGTNEIPKDTESILIWKEVYKKYDIQAEEFSSNNISEKARIFPLIEPNLWKTGDFGPCGPCTEIHYYIGKGKPDLQKERPGYNDENFIEIWNNVFMEFNKTKSGVEKLKQKNVDTGAGFDRLCAIIQNIKEDGTVDKNVSNFNSDLYDTASAYLRSLIEDETRKSSLTKTEQVYEFDYTLTTIKDIKQGVKSFRIILDHIRASTFLIADNVQPSNKDQGYILRRLLRRAIRHAKLLGIKENFTKDLAKLYIEKYKLQYPHLQKNKKNILNILEKEEINFEGVINRGEKEIEKLTSKGKVITGNDLFNLYETYGYPIEMALDKLEIPSSTNKAKELIKQFEIAKCEHQKQSRKGSECKFKGGLADLSEMTKRYHTATHLLLKALQIVLGNHIHQRGSNITSKRLRFDFPFDKPLTEEQISKIEEIVNKQIEKGLKVTSKTMPKKEALKLGAECEFPEKYPENVTVYFIGNFSKEFCCGPHVKNTKELSKSGKFKIIKEEGIGRGIRRIKAILAN